jgi:aspartate oxidase
MNITYTDVLVIGGGLAGLRTAIGVKRRGHDAVVLSLVPAKRSHSAAAQGGMQASLGNSVTCIFADEGIANIQSISTQLIYKAFPLSSTSLGLLRPEAAT